MNFKYHWFIYLLITIFILIINSNNIFIQWILIEFGTIIRIRLINIKSTNKILSQFHTLLDSQPRTATSSAEGRGKEDSL